MTMPRHFYQDVLGTVPSFADFVSTQGPEEHTPCWELVVAVDAPDAVAARVRGLGHAMMDGPDHAGEQRLTSPDGLTFHIQAAAS
ncbi:hypothetical protein KYY02_32350 [Streptomyces pimonensis]|uniref:Glyoxalase-like domain-containing protein n=1 Tax=Streptomyces pimonensis TaxID=2860288 RepID=A0ABV4J8D3_9ACTN